MGSDSPNSSSAVTMIDAHTDEVCVQMMTTQLGSLIFFKPPILLLLCKSINPWISAENYIFLPTQCSSLCIVMNGTSPHF